MENTQTVLPVLTVQDLTVEGKVLEDMLNSMFLAMHKQMPDQYQKITVVVNQASTMNEESIPVASNVTVHETVELKDGTSVEATELTEDTNLFLRNLLKKFSEDVEANIIKHGNTPLVAKQKSFITSVTFVLTSDLHTEVKDIKYID